MKRDYGKPVTERRHATRELTGGESDKLRQLLRLHAKIASVPPLDCYDDIVRPCRGCRNIGRDDKCTVFRCPENMWWGTRGKCPQYEREEVAR